jgi:hypothetical protein
MRIIIKFLINIPKQISSQQQEEYMKMNLLSKINFVALLGLFLIASCSHSTRVPASRQDYGKPSEKMNIIKETSEEGKYSISSAIKLKYEACAFTYIKAALGAQRYCEEKNLDAKVDEEGESCVSSTLGFLERKFSSNNWESIATIYFRCVEKEN